MQDYVFISYARKDRFFAELLATKLAQEKKPIKFWRDKSSILEGDEWSKTIDSGIRNSAVVALVLSHAGCESKFVSYEWAYALGAGKPIIPILLEDCDMHSKIKPIQYSDFRNHTEENWLRLINTLRTVMREAETEENSNSEEMSIGVELSSKEVELSQKIRAYLLERGFRMMSFDRVRDKISQGVDYSALQRLVDRDPQFRSATLKGGKPGLAML